MQGGDFRGGSWGGSAPRPEPPPEPPRSPMGFLLRLKMLHPDDTVDGGEEGLVVCGQRPLKMGVAMFPRNGHNGVVTRVMLQVNRHAAAGEKWLTQVGHT